MSEPVSGDETIFAPASGFGRAGICVIRVSGPQTRDLLEALAGGVPPARMMSLRVLRDPQENTALDQALVVFFPGPASFTGEDQAELHIHGGLAVRQAVLAALSEIPGCRPAEAGEFTRRAFLNGRMDLSEVEGLADLIDAETESQRRQALRQLDGGLGAQAERWREEAISCQAMLEGALDFADEGDIPDQLENEAQAKALNLSRALEEHLRDARRGERLREGFHVVLAGPPNAGKSTLLNALARRDVAIVSPIAGTTRDVIEVRCDLDGLPVTIIDTAGLREAGDVIEEEGMARARGRMAQADLVLWLDPADDPAPLPPDLGPHLHVITKIDRVEAPVTRGDIAIAALSGEGMDALLARLRDAAESLFGEGDALITRERHRAALNEACEALRRGCAQAETELFAEDMRLAARAIGRISGRVDVEDVLDQLFSSFCIGK
ncbi:MAG: tRNA uridine-5-carboxymethylaminomethyl(34) synthesis GTPase MnmE [Salinarimonas sp.]|nr:tRNA uridine-5-carboxymethylaminomethyl(34) synthesis GTPase MnmE [Salinarimonas sp.]